MKEDPELSSFFNWDRLEDFKNFGGIRLEDGPEHYLIAVRSTSNHMGNKCSVTCGVITKASLS